MAQDKQLSRIEAKLDLLLKKQGMSEKEVSASIGRLLDAAAPTRPERKLTAEEQQAIDNAPKTPVGAQGPVGAGPRVTATNAPATPAATEAKSKR